VHVCRRWRCLVFGAPRRLNLKIACTNTTPAREKLDVWPALPIVVRASGGGSTRHLDNIKAALDHNDRICNIRLHQLEDVFTALEKPFPALTVLELRSYGFGPPVFLDPFNFLGGTSHLRSFSLVGVRITGLMNLLSVCTGLVDLRLIEIPQTRFISPEAIFTIFSLLTRLERFHLLFTCPADLEGRPPSTPTPTVLPALTHLYSEVSASTWRTSWPGLMPLYSTT
jgi:hypothetical protein